MSIKRHSLILIFVILSVMLPLVYVSLPVNADTLRQQPTASMPTVTGTPTGPMVMVLENGQEQFVNVRSGPGPFYPKVGVLLVGQKAPAIGKSAGGDYIIIRYEGVPGNTGWVYASYVTITGGGTALAIVEPPPTPTPVQTSTIDPTLAAQFIVTSVPTRLATYTPPPPLSIPTFTAEENTAGPGNIPMGMIIFALAAIGILTGLFSMAQRR